MRSWFGSRAVCRCPYGPATRLPGAALLRLRRAWAGPRATLGDVDVAVPSREAPAAAAAASASAPEAPGGSLLLPPPSSGGQPWLDAGHASASRKVGHCQHHERAAAGSQQLHHFPLGLILCRHAVVGLQKLLGKEARPFLHGPSEGRSPSKHASGVDHHGSAGQVACGLCSTREARSGERARRMPRCHQCRRRFHLLCLRAWARNRDIFNWSNWVCNSCRHCTGCGNTGEEAKVVYCKWCDKMYHIVCVKPPLRNNPKGPFLCAEHVSCFTCNSRAPGIGTMSNSDRSSSSWVSELILVAYLETFVVARWLCAFTMCDACGHLFSKGRYCSICLKVYRDTEPAPMVCCDNCEHWVHCFCDGISLEQYQHYQSNAELKYMCAACRGLCRKVQSHEDGVAEIWRRKNKTFWKEENEAREAKGLPPLELAPDPDLQSPAPESDAEDLPPTAVVDSPGSPLKSQKRSEKKSKKTAVSSAEGFGDGARQKLVVTLHRPGTGAGRRAGLPGSPIEVGVEDYRNGSSKRAGTGQASEAKPRKRDDRARHDGKRKRAVVGGAEAEQPSKGLKIKLKLGPQVALSENSIDNTKAPTVEQVRKRKRQHRKNHRITEEGEELGEALRHVNVKRGVSGSVGEGQAGEARSKDVEATAEPGPAKDSWTNRSRGERAMDCADMEGAGKQSQDSGGQGDVEAAEPCREAENDKGSAVDLPSRRAAETNGALVDERNSRRERSGKKRTRLKALQVAGSHGVERNHDRADLGTGSPRTPAIDGKPAEVEESPDAETSGRTPKEARLPILKLVYGDAQAARRSSKLVDGAAADEQGAAEVQETEADGREAAVQQRQSRTPGRLLPRKANVTNLLDGGRRGQSGGLSRESQRGEAELRDAAGDAAVPGSPETDGKGRSKRSRVPEPTLGQEDVGRRIEVYWPLDNTWYSGCLKSVSAPSGKFVVLYDDGEEEELVSRSEKVRFASGT
eukprot:SM000082S22878  [mRNA]  locus=s82:540667:545222:+ [translate_table: standard]